MKPFIRHYPKDLTSYDFLKSLAVITMVIDHIGMYFFPDQLAWRVIGRLSLPIWMFLIGYAQTRDIPMILWAGGASLLIGNIFVGMPIFPLNILFTIIIIRLLLDPVVRFTLMNFQTTFLSIFTMIFLIFPTMFVVEYGSAAMLFALFGYAVRHQTKLKLSNEIILIYMAICVAAYTFFEKAVLGFNDIEYITMGAGVLLVCLLLSFFKPVLYPDLTTKWPSFSVSFFKLMGRRTLEIYIVHLLVFKAAVLWLFPEQYVPFNFSLF